MQKLYIEATSTTPRIVFEPDEGKLMISGRSMPEDSDAFYSPVFSWLE
ncbi:MAG: SiaC family regulatory phosphoprotein [Bacteroidales bacterium]|nr:SiaC family regulatory phosphoprotein [Bacteroidales bacterium]